jgi:uncharacterized protein YcfJ
MSTKLLEKPIRVGIFDSMAAADQAVRQLLRANFTKDQITVICSDKHREKQFAEFGHQTPGGAKTPVASATGSAIGAVLGGLASVAGVVTTGGIGLLAAGAIVTSAGAVVGGFIGAMMTRGIDKELANFYDQAVERGDILVAAEDHSERAGERLAVAQRILAEAGAKPLPLREG